MAFPRFRILIVLLMLSVAGALAAPATSPAAKHKLAPREGGKVHSAWPAKARAKRPHRALARFLAKQVGPVMVAKRGKAKSALRARASATGPLIDFLPNPKTSQLRLVRSFDIPADDPAAERLLNLSWTYDTAIATIALINAGEQAQAEQLLDQLAALQRTDGSIDYAFDVTNGASMQLFNTGAIAWTGIAASLYRSVYGSKKYDALAGGAANWLLERRLPSGLLSGGPTVKWASTQHNLAAWYFFTLLTDRLPSGVSASAVTNARDTMAKTIKSTLLVNVDEKRMAFNQGADDPMRPLDVQTLGIMFLSFDAALGHNPDAGTQIAKVSNYLYSAFPVSGRSVALSKDPLSYNLTWQSGGPFSGFRPYAEGGPDVMWAEGTAQVRFMQRVLGVSTSSLDSSIAKWNSITQKQGKGPLGSDRTASNEINEYHVWPTSAAASWTLLGSTGMPTGPFDS